MYIVYQSFQFSAALAYAQKLVFRYEINIKTFQNKIMRIFDLCCEKIDLFEVEKRGSLILVLQ